MNLLPFGTLAPYRPRRFVPSELKISDWSQLEPLFDQLDQQSAACQRAADLEDWILRWSELSAAIDEEGSRRYIAMTCHTEAKEAETAYVQFVEEIEPRAKPRQFHLAELFLAHPARAGLPEQRFQVFTRDTQLLVDLFRPENVPLETEEAKLGQQYQKLTGSLTVHFRGEEQTLPQMGRLLEEPDRASRQEAWELVANRRLQEADKIEDIFDQLLQLRERIARNAGFDNYRDYAFKARGRFDYGPTECEAFHKTIEEQFMPLVRTLHKERRELLRLGSLRPWDLSVDPLNRPRLRPFEDVEVMVEKSERIFDQLDVGLAEGFRSMQTQKLLDLANRKGKAPGGYQSTLSEARVPFIFMNAVGLQRDVETLLHEAGHAFHALATQEEDLHAYRGAPIEFCEVASMSMELLGNEFLEEFYNTADANRARRSHLEGIITIFPWIATVDAFQHWLYTHPGHSRVERTNAWLGLMERFGGDVDWSGHEKARGQLWHRQLHIFLHPFYYVEYGIAQLGALQVWANSKQDKAQALADYQKGLALGGSRPLPELFAAAGCQFAFDPGTVKPLVDLLHTELEKLAGA